MFLDREDIDLEVGDEVDLLIGHHTDLGVKVVINDLYEGLLYHNEIFQPLKKDAVVKGYVKKIREDGKIDVTLHKFGYRKVESSAEKILRIIKENKGVLMLNDKSEPQEIYAQLQMSKKVFKKAVGALYKQKIIRMEEDGIYLTSSEN